MTSHAWPEFGNATATAAAPTPFRPTPAPNVAAEAWRIVWREGMAPQLSTAGLTALRAGLESDDPAWTQGSTTVPPPQAAFEDWPLEGADAIGYCFWKDGTCSLVGESEAAFARVCFDCDERIGQPAAIRSFLNYHDDAPRAVVRAELAGEIDRVLAERVSAETARVIFI